VKKPYKLPKRSTLGLSSIWSMPWDKSASPMLKVKMINDDANAGLISPGLGNPCQTKFLRFNPWALPINVCRSKTRMGLPMASWISLVLSRSRSKLKGECICRFSWWPQKSVQKGRQVDWKVDQSMDIYFGNWRENSNCINVDWGFEEMLFYDGP
jgi:hypothetical protein